MLTETADNFSFQKSKTGRPSRLAGGLKRIERIPWMTFADC